MAISRVQSKSGHVSPASSVTVTFDSSTTSGNLLVFCVSCYYAGVNAGGTWTASDNKGNTWSSATVTDTFSKMQIFYAENITGGSSHAVTITAGSSTYLIATAIEYSGAATSSSLDQSSSAYTATNTTSYTSPTTGTTSQADEVLVGFHHAYQSAATPTPSGSFSTIVTRAGSSFHTHTVQDLIVSATGTYASAGTWSTTGANHTDAIATFKAAGASGGTGEIATTQEGDTSTATGTVSLTASAPLTPAGNTLTSAGTVRLIASLAATQSSNSVATAGSLTLKGALTATVVGDTLAATGVYGTFTAGAADLTQAGNTVSATGTLPLVGYFVASQSGNTLTSGATLRLSGTTSVTQSSQTLTAAAFVGSGGTGVVAVTQSDNTLSATSILTLVAKSFTVTSIALPSYTITPFEPLAPYATTALTPSYTLSSWRVL